jgi:uncharacterized 2Fe-2S/4Fe-4S cluster protein (DUF4445 family)
VEVRTGAEDLTPVTEAESFLRAPYRLACQAGLVRPDAVVEFAILRRRLRILVPEPQERPGPIDPVVSVVDGVVHYGCEPIESLRGGVFGLAVDVGTTTVVFELVDLSDGRTVEIVAAENPQRFGGSDVMNRISYDESEAGHGELRRALRKMVNRELSSLYARRGIDRREVYEVVLVGNSTMRDLAFGLDVSSIGQRPYKSVTELELLAGGRATTTLSEPAYKVGLRVNPRGRVWGAPLVASHVGADVAADLVALGLDGRGDEVVMLVDVGTNTEIVLAGRGRILAASCPAGPAFEGGLVTYGMQGADGAIESLRRQPDGSFAFVTIGDCGPVGICGSGLIDLLGELRRTGFMAPRGQFRDRSQTIDVVPEAGITFSRADASALAQAKAANYAGQFILLRELGVLPSQVDRLYLAGGFASSIDVENAVAIGFLPPVPPERVVKVGNASLLGARELLLSGSARARLEALIPRIEHVELETSSDFFEIFVEGCQFARMAGFPEPADERVAS